jgi:putative FmdB family regulatory protein
VPIYEYQCQQCGHRVELIQKHTDAPLEECPRCHGAMKKLIAAPALQFKGSGWYITDYSAKGKEKSADAPADQKPREAEPAKPAEPAATPQATTADKKSDGGKAPAPPAKSDGGSSS